MIFKNCTCGEPLHPGSGVSLTVGGARITAVVTRVSDAPEVLPDPSAVPPRVGRPAQALYGLTVTSQLPYPAPGRGELVAALAADVSELAAEECSGTVPDVPLPAESMWRLGGNTDVDNESIGR